MQYPPNFIHNGRSFTKAWEEAVNFCMEHGMTIRPESGAAVLTKDVCSKITLYCNAINEMYVGKLHPMFPTKEKHCAGYVKEYTREWVAEQKSLPVNDNKKFVYNYMERLIDYTQSSEIGFDQIKQLRLNMEKCGISRRQQMITWMPEKDSISESPPCLQRIWIRMLEEDTDDDYINAEIHFSWRSRDLFTAWMPNYIGLMNMLKAELFDPLHLKIVKFVDDVDSLHIYSPDWQNAIAVRLYTYRQRY